MLIWSTGPCYVFHPPNNGVRSGPNTPSSSSISCGYKYDVPRGIKNLDNSCFASAVLQALASVPAVIGHAVSTTAFATGAEVQEQLFCALRELSLPAGDGPLVPSCLLDALPRFREEIYEDEVLDDDGEPTGAWNVTYPQHDACEFLEYLMTEGLLGAVGRNCFLQVLSKKTCHNCGTVTKVTDHMGVSRMKFFSLPEKGVVSLQQLWDAQFRPETIKEYRCAACAHPPQENTAITVPRVKKYPEHLIMQINRAGVHGQKLKGLRVDIPDVFQPTSGAPKYFLRSLIRHRGTTARSGHYVAERVYNGLWFCCDDSTVTPGRNMAGDPYIAVYTADGSDLPAAPPTANECLRHLAGRKKGTIKCDICHSDTNDCTFTEMKDLKKHNKNPEHLKAQSAYKRGVKGLAIANRPNLCGLCDLETGDIDAHGHNSRTHKVFSEAYRRGEIQAALTLQNFKRSALEDNDAEDVGDGTVERDPNEAMRMFYDESLPKQSADLSEHHLTDDVAEAVLQGYRARLRDDQVIHECGVCGVRSFDTRDQRTVPLTSPLLDRLKVEEIVPEGCRLKLCAVPGKNIHCDERCVVGEELLICRGCHYHMTTQDTAPVGSFKRLDFGEVPLHLPDLSVCEKALLSRVLVQRTVIKLHVRGGGMQCSTRYGTPYKGHVISFRQEPSFMRTFMDVGMLEGHITVVFVGKSIGGDHVKHALEHLHSVFQVRADVLQQWITWLSLHNPMYFDCVGHVIDKDKLVAFQAILRKSIIIPDDATALAGIVAEAVAVSSNTGPETDNLQYVHITEKDPQPDTTCASSIIRALKCKIGGEPVNEFQDMRDILLGGFPWLFVRWPSIKYMNDSQVRPLMLRRQSVHARDASLLFFLYDVKVRRELCRTTANSVKTRPGYMHKIAALLGHGKFDSMLDRAITNPESSEAKLLEAQILGFVQTCTRKVNFSPGKRRACRGPLYAMYRRFGLPSFWVTLSPSDNDNVLSLRLSKDNTLFEEFKLPMLHDRAAIIEKNPVLAAHMFDLTVRAVTEIIFGLADESVSLKNVKPKRGAFGDVRGHFGVCECQSRGALHFHCVVFTHLNPNFVSRIVSNPLLNAGLAAAIDSMICSRLDQLGQDETRVRFHPDNCPNGKPAGPGYRAATHPIPASLGPEFEDHIRGACVDTQCHIIHRATCFKGAKCAKEDRMCRFAMKAVVHDGPPGVYHVEFVRDAEGNVRLVNGKPEFKVISIVPELEHNPPEHVFPFPLEDDRALVFLTKTDQDPTQSLKVGSVVVPFSPVLTACVRSNTCVTFMMTQAAATSIFFYLIKYMTKEIHPLAGVIPLLKEAKAAAIKYPSDAQGSVLRPTQHILLKLCNRIHRNMEVSSQMAAAMIIGNKSEYHSHVPVYVDMHSAVKHVSRFTNGDESGSDDGRGSDDDINAAAPFANDDGSAPLGVDNEGNLEILASPEINYAFRGRGLRSMDYYVYNATVLLVNRKDVKDGGKNGRQCNATYDFDPAHPNFMTHTQRLKARHQIPVILGKVPLLPKFENHPQYMDPINTWPSSMRSQVQKFAIFMIALFAPWGAAGAPQYALNWTGLCRLVADTKISNPGKYFIMCNFANDLHGASEKQKPAAEFRKSCADSFTESQVARLISEEYGFDEEAVAKELEKKSRILTMQMITSIRRMITRQTA